MVGWSGSDMASTALRLQDLDRKFGQKTHLTRAGPSGVELAAQLKPERGYQAEVHDAISSLAVKSTMAQLSVESAAIGADASAGRFVYASAALYDPP
jgi:hypothetical protein